MTRRVASAALLSALSIGVSRADLPRTAGEIVVKLPGGKQVTAGSYKGKVLVLGIIVTSCEHCQQTCTALAALYREFGSRGFTVLIAAIEKNPDIAGFIKKLNLPYEVGEASHLLSRKFMDLPEQRLKYAPWLSFIDREGRIQKQYTGGDATFLTKDAEQEKQNLRHLVEQMLAEGQASGPGPRPAAAKEGTSKK